MIRLTVNAQSEPKIHLFHKTLISIGSETAQADLQIPEEGLQPIFLNIIQQNGFPIITNIANDPFISLNGHPFGKKLLNNGDVILVHDTEILFEILAAPREEEKKIEPLSFSLLDIELSFGTDILALKDEEWHQESIDNFISAITPEEIAVKTVSNVPKAPHLKDDYLKHLDDDRQEPNQKNLLPALNFRNWVFLFFGTCLILGAIFGSIFYIDALKMVKKDEIAAARGVADMSMALTHAKLFHIKPHNHNWSDPEFLNSNLNGILANSQSYVTDTTPQSQFTCCPYTLRIYTSRDLSRFILIAQPEPSLFQWLAPKSVIIVDSESMELTGINDVRSINRLLANANPLEGANGKEITRILKEGKTIQLASLKTDNEGGDFIPPAEVALIKPGAENFIYNAPRYYQLGQPIIQKANELIKAPGNIIEMTALKQDVEAFSRFPIYILFSKDGKKEAWLTQKGLATFAPSNNLLYGYLTFNEDGEIVQSSLLQESRDYPGLTNVIEEGAIAIEDNPKKTEPVEIDQNNPIYLYLLSLTTSRENELKIFASEIRTLVAYETQFPQDDFASRLEIATQKYIEVDNQHNDQIKQSIKSLYTQYGGMPLNEFMEFVAAANLQYLVQNTKSSIEFQKEWQSFIDSIDTATSFFDLNRLVDKVNSSFHVEELSDPQQLLHYQNLFRVKLLETIEARLLSAESHVALNTLDEKERACLKEILCHEHLIRLDENEYFISELATITETLKPKFQLQGMDSVIKALNKPRPSGRSL